MSDAAFDVLDAQDALRGAGFTEAQTRALTHTFKAVATTRQGDLATRADIADLRTEITGLETRLLKARNDQQRWTIGVMVVLIGVLFAAIVCSERGVAGRRSG